MAAMTTALAEYTSNGNSRTYETAGNTIVKPKLCIAARRVPTGNQTVSEVSFRVIHATEDSEGEILREKVSFAFTCRFPLQGDTTDRDAALVIFRDFVASDECTSLVSSGSWPA